MPHSAPYDIKKAAVCHRPPRAKRAVRDHRLPVRRPEPPARHNPARVVSAGGHGERLLHPGRKSALRIEAEPAGCYWGRCRPHGRIPLHCLGKGLHVRTWRLRGLCTTIRGPYRDKSDRVGHALPERADRRRNPTGHTNHATAAATRIAPAPVRPSSQVGWGGDERRGKREERRGGREREDRITQGGVSPWTCTAVDIRTGIDGGGEAAAAAWWWYQLPLLAAQPAHIGSAASRSAAV